jgi:hypothetical protein
MSEQLISSLDSLNETQKPSVESNIQQIVDNNQPDATVNQNNDQQQVKPKKHWAEERIRKYAGKVHGLESELEKERREKAELQAQLENYKKSMAPKKPELSEYNDPVKYEQAMIEYVKSQVTNGETTRQNQSVNQPGQQFDQNELRISQEFERSVQEVSKLYPDVTDEDFYWIETNKNLANAIAEIRNIDPRKAAELAYKISSDVELSTSLEGASPYTIGLKLGQILSTLDSSKQKQLDKKLTSSPSPIEPVSGNSASVAFDYEKASAEDYIRKRNEEERAKRNRK